jgi:hypothetical protein
MLSLSCPSQVPPPSGTSGIEIESAENLRWGKGFFQNLGENMDTGKNKFSLGGVRAVREVAGRVNAVQGDRYPGITWRGCSRISLFPKL